MAFQPIDLLTIEPCVYPAMPPGLLRSYLPVAGDDAEVRRRKWNARACQRWAIGCQHGIPCARAGKELLEAINNPVGLWASERGTDR